MRPDAPEEHIHSGTGEAPGPSGPARGVRNPQPLPADLSGQARPVPTNAEDDSPNGNGYWQHDESGPRTYVPPLVGQGEALGVDDDVLRRLSEALVLRLAALPEWGVQSVHLRRLDGVLCLVGLVASDIFRDAAGDHADLLAGEPVENRLVVS
jgi:hypothetical protein